MLSEKTPTNSTLARTSSKDNSIMPSFMSSNSSTTVNGGSCCKKKKNNSYHKQGNDGVLQSEKSNCLGSNLALIKILSLIKQGINHSHKKGKGYRKYISLAIITAISKFLQCKTKCSPGNQLIYRHIACTRKCHL